MEWLKINRQKQKTGWKVLAKEYKNPYIIDKI
jgi:hypothetical protein